MFAYKLTMSSVIHACLSFITHLYSILFCKNTWPWKSGEYEEHKLKPPKRESRWIRPLGYVERFMTLAGECGNMSTVYALSLESETPITFDSIKLTSKLICRKMPHLRLCVGKHKNYKWWKEMDVEKLDVEEISLEGDELSTFESLLQKRYNNSEGPLWFVRFISPHQKSFSNTKLKLKRKYLCIFGFSHNVSDGTTNMNFCNIFISLLNDILLNKELDLQEEGHFAFPIHDEMANSGRSNLLLLKLFAGRVYKGFLSCNKSVRNFINYFYMPKNKTPFTRVLRNEFDEITTERLLKRCKMENVTLNSAFTAAANVGMFRMILQKNPAMNKTRFDSQHAINMRRYWPKEKQRNSYGCHISMANIQIPTNKEDIINFWEYTRSVQKIIYNELNVEKKSLTMQPLSEGLWIAQFLNIWASRLGLPSANDSHCCITNMGNVSSTFSGNDSPVKVTNILRSVSGHYMQALCQHTLQTFKGKLYYSLDYYTQKMSVETARVYTSSLMDTLRAVVHLPN